MSITITTTHYTERPNGHIAGMVLDPYEIGKHDPFLFLAHDDFPEGTFGPHPHRGIETVTYVLNGTVYHHDTANGGGILEKGDVQWMTAGHGVLHSEEPAPGTRAEILQLWINLPQREKMRESDYQTLHHKQMPLIQERGVNIRIFAGEYNGTQAPTKLVQPTHFYEVTMEKGTTWTTKLPHDWKTFIVLLEGKGTVGDEQIPIKQNQAAHFDTAGHVTIKADEKMRILLYSGKPTNETIAARGPFVMTTDDELRQTFRDYQAGYFHNLKKKDDTK